MNRRVLKSLQGVSRASEAMGVLEISGALLGSGSFKRFQGYRGLVVTGGHQVISETSKRLKSFRVTSNFLFPFSVRAEIITSWECFKIR